jgi:hypothetical protein
MIRSGLEIRVRGMIRRSMVPTAMLLAIAVSDTRAVAGQMRVITEVGAEFPLGSTGGHFPASSGDIDNHVAVTLGVMNRWKTAAFGLTGSAMTTGAKDGARGEVRYQSRTRGKPELRASAGYARWSVPGTTSNRAEPANGITGSAGIDGGWIGVDARLDLLRASEREVTAFSVGAHLAEKPAKAVMASALVLGLMLFLGSNH